MIIERPELSHQPEISIVILNWNSSNHVLKCIESIFQWKYEISKLKIFIIDNGSKSQDLKELKEIEKDVILKKYSIKIISHVNHPGVTSAFNSSIEYQALDSKYFLRLDNDVTYDHKSIFSMISYMEKNEKVGVIGPKIFHEENKRKINSVAIKLNKWTGKAKLQDTTDIIDCDTLLGATMLFRSESLMDMGRVFDPNLFLFAEEVECCFKLSKLGWKIQYYPFATAYHEAGTSTNKHSNLSLFLNWKNHVSVYNKIFPKYTFILRNLLVMISAISQSIKHKNLFPIAGFIYGFIGIKLTQEWWNKVIENKDFEFPKIF